MRTQRTRSQRYIAAHAAVLVTRAEKLSRRYLRAGDSVLQYSRARSYGPVRTYVRARVPKRSGTEWNGTNGTELITSVFNWERYKRNGITRKLFFDSYCTCRLMRRRIKVADPRIFLIYAAYAAYIHIRKEVVDEYHYEHTAVRNVPGIRVVLDC